MSLLKGKKILLFTTKFFGYELEICKELKKLGAIVKYYDERNNASSVEKILIRKMHWLMDRKIYKYYKRITDIEKEFMPDYVLFISPEALNKKSIIYMKEKFEKTQFILYMWDSMENINAKRIYKYFTRCFSFDPNDCQKYDLIFRPLFFIESFEKESNDNKCEYDFTFIGSIHSDRAKILNNLRKQFEEKKLKFYYYLYIPGKLMLFIRLLLDRNLRQLIRYVHITAISKDEVSKIAAQSNYIIDINHPKQIGLTMRTIEMLGSHKKILTTNDNIKKYDFYNPSNQLIISRKDNHVNLENIINGFDTIKNEIYNKYKISSWIKELFMLDA